MMHEDMPRQPEPELMDDSSEAYAYAVADFAEVNRAFAQRLVELAGRLDEARAVDLGTGPGDIPVLVARAMPGWSITAVDASEPMLRYAHEAASAAGLADRIRLLLADVKDTGLPAGGFDVVFSNSILHHITDTASFWSEVRRIAAPGAVVLVRDLARPDSASSAEQIVHTYAAEETELLREEFYRSLLSAYTPQEVCGQLTRAGLNRLRVETVSDRHLDVCGTLP